MIPSVAESREKIMLAKGGLARGPVLEKTKRETRSIWSVA
jgi:hypothetical protein